MPNFGDAKSKKRVLIVAPTPPPPNGATVTTELLLGSSLGKEFELRLLDTADRRGIANIGRLDLQNVCLALRHGGRFVHKLLTERPDVIYLPIAQNGLGFLRDSLFLVPARLRGVKVIVHLHGSRFRQFYDECGVAMRALIRFSLAGVWRAVVLGNGARSCFDGLVPPDRVIVVPNGIDGGPYQRERRPRGSFRIVFLGNLWRSKGFVEVIRAMPAVVREVPDAVLMLAGEACDREAFTEAVELTREFGIERNIDFRGVVTGSDKTDLMAISDALVFPPTAPEGQPLVILEAMAAGVPVVTTPQGCIGETVRDGVTGFLVPSGAPGAIAEAILTLARDPRLRRRMGECGRRRFLRRYTHDRWVRDMERVFEEAA